MNAPLPLRGSGALLFLIAKEFQMDRAYVICNDQNNILCVDGTFYCHYHLFEDPESFPIFSSDPMSARLVLCEHLSEQIDHFREEVDDEAIDYPYASLEDLSVKWFPEVMQDAVVAVQKEQAKHQKAEEEATPVPYHRYVYENDGNLIGKTLFLLLHEGWPFGVVWETNKGDVVSETGDEYGYHFCESHRVGDDEHAYYLSEEVVPEEKWAEWVKTQQYGHKNPEEGDDDDYPLDQLAE
jgi:hypothetical protein